MARILVKAMDHVHSDPEIDRQGAYKRGDVVCVMPDGHVWGAQEGLPVFEQVDFPGVSVEDMQHTVNSHVATLSEITSVVVRKNLRLLRLAQKHKARPVKTRRRYTVDLDTKVITDKTR